jgi:hypothetical protein
MRLGATLKRFFGQMGEVSDLARADRVASLVPDGARYVTVGPITVLPDVRAFNEGEPGQARRGVDLGYLPARFRQEIALLVLTRDRLAVVERPGLYWSCDLTRVTDLDGRRAGGFLVFTSGVEGVAVGPQTPVEVPPGAGFGTVSGRTNLFGGWDEALAPHGVRRHF